VITRTAGGEVSVPVTPVPPAQAVEGDPVAGAVTLPGPPGLEVGIWEHSVGTSTDVEEDEVFVVLSGRATIGVEDGPATDVGPGDVVTLRAGTRTTWTIHEPLRKVFVVAAG
jgi:uncharacterized cupin superfamily protein